MTRIVLVRHGESACNERRVVGGHAGCTGLAELGVRQAEALRDRLARTGELGEVAALYSSVLRRAVETAEVLSPALGGLAVIADCGFCELHPGEADGMRWEDYDARYGAIDWAEDPDRPMAPGGESWTSFQARVEARLARLVACHEGETVVVACHGGVISASLRSFLGIPRRDRSVSFEPRNTSITEWVRADGTWKLARYNDVAHLAQAGLPG
jgi:probable phosphoglycerate mutase